MRLVVQEFLSLDGVSQGPGGPDEDTSGGFSRGGWFVSSIDGEFERVAGDWLGRAEGLLFGADTYRNFARDWPGMDHPFAPVMNALPKYVVSRTLTPEAALWDPTTVLDTEPLARLAELRARPGAGELQVHGSARLAGTLLAAGLVDTLRLVIAPVVVGQGRRLFPATGPALGFRPVERRVLPGGLTVLELAATGTPSFGTYGAGSSGPVSPSSRV
ncbi:dihydrofolate reductase family protein (plasmid) [Streptomyces sp. BI20]|uniref:dihydrofolate reductase family protein n=1 Tax=Streptomyces sp. BI20 TaxID=3403460 RepID=UPI003C795E88